MYNSFIDAKGFGRIFGPGNTYRMYNSTVVNLSGRIFQHPAPGQEVKLVNNIIVAYPGSNYQIMPDTGYVWSSAAGPMLFKNNRLPDNLSTYTYASGAQVVFTNNDTLPVFFVDSANGDYRLSLLDDHHNLGDTSVTLYTDMNGHARPDVNGYVDYGAYESDATRCDQNQSRVQATTAVRANSNVSMSVTGRNLVSYLWSNGDTTATTSVYPHTPTTYWVSALDTDGCTVSDTLTIQTVDVTFRVDLRNQVLSTNGVHVAGTWNAWQSNVDSLLDGNGDLIYETTIGLVVGDTVQYKFINGNSWSDPCDQLPPSCGVSQPFGNRYYEVTVADTLTAVYLSSCDENQPIDPLVDVLPTKCIGTSVDLSAGTDVTNVLWNTGDTTNTISVTAPGKYYFSAIYPNGVIVSDTTTLSDFGPAFVSLSSTITSANVAAQVTLNATGGLNYTYVWDDSTGSSSRIVYPNQTTSYWVIATDTNGCQASDTIVVNTVDITFQVDLSTQPVNTSKGVHLAGNFNGWQPDSTAMTDANGDGIYTVTVGLVAGDSTIQYKFINGDSWSDPHDQVSGFCSVNATGDRLYAVPFTNDTISPVHLSSCTIDQPVDVLVDVQPTVCYSDTVILDAGTSVWNVVWNTGDTSQTLAVTQPGTYWFSANYWAGNPGITVYDTTVVNHFAMPDTSVTASGSLDFCLGSSVTLSAASGQSYMWNTGDTTQSITATQAGSYYAVVTTSNGCSDTTATYTTSLYADPDTTVTASQTIFCASESATISAAGGYDYLWNTGDTTQSITVNTAGGYYVTLTSSDGCSATSDTTMITVVPDIVLPQITSNGLGWVITGSTTGFSVPVDTNYTYQWGIQGGSIQFGQGTDSIAVLWGIPDSNVAVWVVISNGVCSDSVGISINISGIGTDEGALQNVRLFPNPNDGYFTIEVGEAFVGASYEIVDGMGRPIERGEIQSQTQAFDLADKPKGVYRIALTKNDKRKTLIVVIQ